MPQGVLMLSVLRGYQIGLNAILLDNFLLFVTPEITRQANVSLNILSLSSTLVDLLGLENEQP
jgi:hypothetical protein